MRWHGSECFKKIGVRKIASEVKLKMDFRTVGLPAPGVLVLEPAA